MATEQQSVSVEPDPSPSTPQKPNNVRFLSVNIGPDEISLVPYAKIDAGWTIADDIVLNIARQCQREGTFKRVFCEGEIESPEQFLELLKLPNNAPVFIFRGRAPIGFAWLNGFAGNIAFGHFCFLIEAWGKDAEPAGRMVLDYWMSFPAIQVIIGTTPETNGPAANYAERIGFVRLGAIPRMVHNVHLGKNVAAIVLYYVRP